MSTAGNNKTDLFPDGSGECKLSEESRVETVDSGFLSGGNILVSEEIERQPPPPSPSLHHHHQEKESSSAHMHIDSGVDLSEKLSNLSLKHPELNDLNTAKPTKTTITNEEQPPPAQKQPWEIYYEQDEDGDTQLHAAIIQEFPEVALALIRLAPHPGFLDTPNDDAETPLHLAVATGQAKIARTLIVAGARPSPRNLVGDSPLHIAAQAGDVSCCKAILDPVHQQEREALALSYLPQSYQSPNLEQWNYDGQTCVHVAAIHGHVEVLRHLVWNGADINSREGTMGYTALHLAVARGDERLIHFLLTECPKLNPDTVSYGGRSALQIGCTLPSSLVNILVARGVPSPYSSEDEEDDSSSEDEDETICFSNLTLDDFESNELNVTLKPPTNEEQQQQQQQPWENYFEQGEDGETQLHAAIIQEFPEVALALIRLAPHPGFLDTPNDDAETPLHLAVATGQAKIARTLIVAGARPSPRNLVGDSPLHIAAQAGDVSCCKAILDPVHQQEREALALSYLPQSYQSPNLEQWNYDGQTCVHVAAIHGHVEVLRHLVWNGADINSREGTMGYTALHLAVARGDERLIHFLLTECPKLNPDTVSYGGRSALQIGCTLPSSLVNILVARGVPSPYSSEDEEDDNSSGDEMIYETSNTNIYVPIFVNASA